MKRNLFYFLVLSVLFLNVAPSKIFAEAVSENEDDSLRIEDSDAIINCEKAGDEIVGLEKDLKNLQDRQLVDAGISPEGKDLGDSPANAENDRIDAQNQIQLTTEKIQKIKQVCHL